MLKSSQTDIPNAMFKALIQVQALLHKGTEVSEDEIHAVKSILYAAIEQTGMKADRFVTLQRMLRELFAIVTAKPDLRNYEKAVGLQILSEISRYCPPHFSGQNSFPSANSEAV